MILSDIRTKILAPAFKLLPTKLYSLQAEVGMLAIGLQESKFIHQKQIGGPAHGLWQFERGGGVRGVLNHPASKAMAIDVCKALGIPAEAEAVYQKLAGTDDRLDACFSRLLMYTDAFALPKIDDERAWWQLYIRTWRPGKPHPKEWPANFAAALKAVRG